jgi:RimJ/RimL family protein N-acetyltransferase
MDHDKDPEVESRWTHDAYYQRMMYLEPARPLSAAQVKKKYENIEKELEEKNNRFYFTIRLKEDDRLLGFGELQWIDWSNGAGRIRLGIGGEQDRGCGYGSEALRLLLRFAFDELNLYRVSAAIPEYNDVALHVFKKAGFIEEVRRREALYRDGRRWDQIQLGLLREEWKA